VNATDFIEILKVVNIMEEFRFWALWATGSVAVLGLVAAQIIKAIKRP
jgi:hypothetical protein